MDTYPLLKSIPFTIIRRVTTELSTWVQQSQDLLIKSSLFSHRRIFKPFLVFQSSLTLRFFFRNFYNKIYYNKFRFFPCHFYSLPFLCYVRAGYLFVTITVCIFSLCKNCTINTSCISQCTRRVISICTCWVSVCNCNCLYLCVKTLP